MFGQKWGFQRNRTKSEGGALLGDPKQQQASTSHPGKGGANHAHLGSQDSEEKAKGKRMLELCHEGNVTAVHQFCMSNAHSIFQSINSPMDVNLNTPLHLTVAQNDLVMTCLLLQKGADPNVANKSGVMPLSIAKRMGFVKIAKALVMHGAIIPLKEERVLYNGSAGSGASGSSSAAVGGGGGAGGGAGGPGGSDRRRDRRGHAKDPSLAATAASSSLPTSRDGGNTTNAAVAVTSVSNSVGSNGAGGGTDADFVGNVTLPVLGSSGGVTLFGSTAASAITDDDLIRREAFKDSIQSKVFPVYNAAFLGFKDPLLHALTPETIDAFDEAGWTCLMKAAYKGHLGLVTELVRRNASLDATDHHGYTALIWAIVAGRMNVVKFLVDEAGASIEGNRQEPQDSSSLSASGSRNDLNWQSRPSITPLIAATHYGHVEAVEYLLAKGANVNARAGTGKGRSALMIAAWTRRKNLVKLLLQNGAIVDPDVDSWLSKGIIHLKKVTVEQNVWLSHTGTDAYNALRRDHVSTSSMALHQAGIAAPGGIPPAGAQQTRRASLQDKVMYFSPEDSEIATEISEMLQRRAGAVAVGNSGLGVMGGDPSMIRSQTTQMSRMNMQRRRNMTFRQGLNLDKIIGNNSDMVMALAEHMPDRGTELDGLWIAVFQCVVQLVMAANKNIKHHYIAISAKAIHCASEIIRAIEMIDKTTSTAGKAPVTTASVAAAAAAAAVAAASGSGVAMAAKSASLASGTTGDLSMFSKTPVRARIKELSRTIGTEFPKQLMLSTRMAIGVWPPPAAVADMTGEAISLAASCRELVMLANTLGHYPVLDKNLEVSFHAFEESEDAGDELPSASSSSSASHSDSKLEAGTVFKGALSYSEYKRQNDLKLIEEMSKRYDLGARQPSQDVLTPEEKAADADFFKTLDSLLKQFVVSVAELKNVHDQHLKEEFIKATSTVHARADTLMEEIQSFELLKDIPDDVVLDQEDVTRLEASGVKLPMVEYPYPLKPILRTAFEDVKTAARQVMAKGKIASASWPPPNSASEMLQATIPCVLSVKKVVILAKETATKVRHTFLEERRKQDNWRKECLQNERVKQLFQMWEGQLLGDQNPIGKKPATQLTKEELSFLEDSPEGLVAEEINGKRVIKGGRLNKLLEASTHHMVNDEDFMAAMIMTHHSFTTTTELMDQLFKRYDIAPPYGLNQRMFDVYLDKKVVQVRLRVCHVLLHWIQNHFEEDFVDYEQYILRYRDFVEKKVAFDFEQLSVTMLQALDAKLLEEPRARMIPQLGAEREKQCPKPILPTRAFAGVDLLVALTTDLKAFMDIDPQEMARQLTLVEFELFARVKPYECLDQIWDGHRRKEAQAIKGANPKRHDPNSGNTDISKLIQHTNQLSFWIATNIASQDNLKMRMNIVKYFVQVAMHCRELNNLTGVTTIIGAFTMSPISRLHKTWKILEDKHPKISDAYKELADIVSPRFQYANYRKVLKEMAPPAIPFLGVYLTDLTFIELGNPDFLPDSHFINFEKRRKVYNLIREIQRFEQVPFALTPVPAIQEFVRRLGDKRGAPTGWEEMPLMTEDELYDRSLIIEPREEETDSDDN